MREYTRIFDTLHYVHPTNLTPAQVCVVCEHIDAHAANLSEQNTKRLRHITAYVERYAALNAQYF